MRILQRLRGRKKAQGTPPASGQQLIDAERVRQVEVERWTAAHDDAHADELGWAAWCYRYYSSRGVPPMWPWELRWWKPKSRIENLVRAGALYQAKLDSLIRQGYQAGTVQQRSKVLGTEQLRDECAAEVDGLLSRAGTYRAAVSRG